MSKKASSYWYSLTHRVYHPKPLEITYANGVTDYIHFTAEKSEDGYLYSKGTYKTKIRPEELPPEYIYGRWFKQWGFIDGKNMTDMIYEPNMFVNHLFKDDLLYIKYGGKLTKNYDKDWDREYINNYDMIAHGWDIITVLEYARAFSNIDREVINNIYKDIRKKVIKYAENYPDEHDAITPAEFTEDVKRYRERARMAKSGMNWQDIEQYNYEEFLKGLEEHKNNIQEG